MKRPIWSVGNHGIRPAGSPTACFYCGAGIAEQHKPDCVIRSRTVVVKMEIDLVVTVPESWTPEDIEFHRHESSWCASSIINDLENLANRKDCLCQFTEFKFVREATEEDEEKQGVFVNILPS